MLNLHLSAAKARIYGVIFLASTLPPLINSSASDSWNQWRGPAQNGVAMGENYPEKWNADSGIKWKSIVPGNGGSTPVVSGNLAYVTSGVDGKNQLIAYNLENGSTAWSAEIGVDRGGKHKKGSGSNPSAVIDGENIYAYFRSGDLACVNMKGETVWHTNLQNEFGEDTLWWDLGSSPTLTKDTVIVVVMQTGPSYLIAYDKNTGKQKWKTDRMVGAPEEAAQSYSTPVVIEQNGEEWIGVMGADHFTLHRASDGKELGRLGGFNPEQNAYFRSISSPVASGNLMICPYARGATITAIHMQELASGKGEKAIRWFRDDLGSDVPTPASKDGKIYVVGDGRTSRGLISCLDAETGTTIWEVQLPKSRISFSSSPLIAGDHLYVTNEKGTTYVVGPLSADEPALVSENTIDDEADYTVASPIPANQTLLIRSKSNLYRISGN
ncbi:PQQ-like beta-propeller repeat protein [Rhodopirellula sp.]|jgi:outer membrane protein assembly factor BamB|nr:PQQ-like beta-propeller repeat protein [Rhodopirellula sp.]MDA9778568.1 PQQ-like beta-propeller repeat protein [Rubripirellula sp.]